TVSSGHITFGGQGDSWYEYLLKQYIYSHQKNDQYRRMYEESIDAMKEKMVKTSIYDSEMAYVGDLDSAADKFNPKFQHLTCFVPGMLALGSKTLDRPDDLELAKKLAYTCYQMYNCTNTGLGPEYVLFRDSSNQGLSEIKDNNDFVIEDLAEPAAFEKEIGFYFGNDRSYILRPETLESLMILYRITGDEKYKEWGWSIFQAIEKWTKTPSAYSAYGDVQSTKGRVALTNSMESFFLAETLKYLYLLFSPADYYSLDDTNATVRFSWYPTNDITAFDKALNSYVNGQTSLDEFQSVFRCSGLDDLGGFNANHGKSVIRYHRSMICADILNSQENISECYKGKRHAQRRRSAAEEDGGLQLAKVIASRATERRDAPAQLCQSTCFEWIESLKSIVTNTTLCAANAGIDRGASLESLRSKCEWQAFNGTAGTCVSGDDNEIGTCGYQRVEDWCRYCRNASDYQDTCASVGVHVNHTSTQDKGRPGIPTPTHAREPNDLAEELEKKSHREKMYRIAAIVLSIALGICLIALMIVIATSSSRGLKTLELGLLGEKSGLKGIGKADGPEGGEGVSERADRPTDFADCFIDAVGKPRQVIRHFFARREDEISLQLGDVVTLQMAFDDGWVVGKNLTTGCEGTFPLMCVMESMPPTLPAQWSVLPEGKHASTDNQVRRPPKAATRSSPRTSIHDNSQTASPGRGLNSQKSSNSSAQFDGNRLSSNLPRMSLGFGTGCTISRISDLSTTQQPVITTSKMSQSPGSRDAQKPGAADRATGSSTVDNSDEICVRDGPRTGNSILDRILGVFSPSNISSFMRSPISTSNTSTNNSKARANGDTSGNGTARFLKRLVPSPMNQKGQQSPIAEGSKPKQGRPHSFNVNHVVHVGVTAPELPLLGGDPNITPPIIPSDVISSVRSGQDSVGSGAGGSYSSGVGGSAAQGRTRQSRIGYREFIASEQRRASTNIGNTSNESYLTAEQLTLGAGASTMHTSYAEHL
ncbi:hypothetical protein GGI12_002459, partial [Dipsacomyces acuminosporus]